MLTNEYLAINVEIRCLLSGRLGKQCFLKDAIMTISAFFAQAAKRESEAEHFYWKYIGVALAQRDLGASDFFYWMSDFRRLRVAAIAEWAGIKEISQFGLFKVAREQLDATLKVDAPSVDLNEAMDIALARELSDMKFFEDGGAATDDALVRRFSEELAEDHRQQAQAVERYKGALPY